MKILKISVISTIFLLVTIFIATLLVGDNFFMGNSLIYNQNLTNDLLERNYTDNKSYLNNSNQSETNSELENNEKKYFLEDFLKEIRGEKGKIEYIRQMTFRCDIAGLDKLIFFEEHLKYLLNIFNSVEFTDKLDNVEFTNRLDLGTCTNMHIQEIRFYFTNLDNRKYYFQTVLRLRPDGILILEINNKEYYSLEKVDYDFLLNKMQMFYEDELLICELEKKKHYEK